MKNSIACIFYILFCLVSAKAQTEPSWKGTWEKQEEHTGATLEVDEEENGVLHFYILAMNGGHTGEVEGTAKIKGNKAFYHLQEEGINCKLEFTLLDWKIEIDQQEFDCDTGLGVYFSGTYDNEKFAAGKPEENLVSLGILQTEEQEMIFRKLVGNKYGAFVSSSQLLSEIDDLDNLSFKGTAAGVRGLYTYMENIILYNEKNEFWCAVIDGEKVYYFTNSSNFSKTLPKTIEYWRGNFQEKEVIFQAR